MKKDKIETTVFIHGHQETTKVTPERLATRFYLDIVSGTNNDKLFLHICSII